MIIMESLKSGLYIRVVLFEAARKIEFASGKSCMTNLFR